MKKKSLILAKCVVLAVVLGLAVGAWSAKLPSPGQSSITLQNSDACLCNYNETSWSITKTPTAGTINSTDIATWTVTVTKVAVSDTTLGVNGYVEVTNTGTANATIGNIVVNLQTRSDNKWVSAAADVADATKGDDAISANIVAAASTETTNGNNYKVSGTQGTFTETLGKSGSLEFTDASDNTIWSLNPQQVIPPGQTVNLYFKAQFNNTTLGLTPGTSVRAEVIVSFGNAGERGGSGSTASNIDINGNGSIDTDEANVRSVPTRITKTVPEVKACNATVVLTDPGVVTTGTLQLVSGGFDNGGIGSSYTLTDSDSFTVSATVSGGTEGNQVTNTAYLNSPEECSDCDCQINLIIGYEEDGITPIYKTFPCCTPLSLQASGTYTVGPSTETTPCTHDQNEWGQNPNGNNIGALLSNNFSAIYPSGVMVGIQPQYYMKFTSAAAVAAYLPQKETGQTNHPNTLNANQTDPTSSNSGEFGAQVLALKLNVDFSANGILSTGFGGLYYVNSGDSLNGQTVSQILAAANTALGGGSLPTGYTYSSFNTLINNLNNSYIDCAAASTWAQTHLSKTPPTP